MSAWYGIPYPVPPLGDLRFRHPLPIEIKQQPNSSIQIKDEIDDFNIIIIEA